MAGYRVQGYRFWIRVVFSGIGILVGAIAVICFSAVFFNIHCSAWGGISGIYAALTFAMHVSVKYDEQTRMKPTTFRTLVYAGISGIVIGVVVFVGYLIKGILTKEKGINFA